MNKCPFCKSENLEPINKNFSQIVRKYKKIEGYTTEEGTYSTRIEKNVCLDCGYVFESMPKEKIQEYIDYKKYFI